jgi:hypothetical protein
VANVPNHTQGVGSGLFGGFANGAQFIRDELRFPADSAIIDAWLKRSIKLLGQGVVMGNRLTPNSVQELHKLGYNPEQIIANGNNIRAFRVNGTTPLDGINAILAYHKG